MTRKIKFLVNSLLSHFNIELQRVIKSDSEAFFLSNLSEELKSRQLLLAYYSVNKLLDVGANTGQYASLMRRIGFNGQIISFEPLTSAFSNLKINASKDEKWLCENFALGDKNEKSVIHISGNSYSSSLLDILPSHIDFDSKSEYIADEVIEIKKMDDIYSIYCNPNDVVMLKIDTQGFEKNVLEGAKQILNNVKLLQLEISIEPLYDKEILFVEMLNYLEALGFKLFALENGIRNPINGKLLQVDGIFVNDKM